MDTLVATTFGQARIGPLLDGLDLEAFDAFDFGVIGFDRAGRICVYNQHEAEAAGLAPARVLGKSLFDEVAPCMNNFMVAERFHEAMATRADLDATIDYVLTLRMRPTRVQLRLVAPPGASRAYVLVRRAVS